MKQLFVNILTKMTPNSIGPTGIQYSIKDGDKTIYIDIDWRYVNPNKVPKLEFTLPFTHMFNDYKWNANDTYTRKVYTLCINSCLYWIDFNPVEVCEIDRLIYNIFSNYQTSQIQAIQHYLNVEPQSDPKTTEQKFEEAQEAVANNE